MRSREWIPKFEDNRKGGTFSKKLTHLKLATLGLKMLLNLSQSQLHMHNAGWSGNLSIFKEFDGQTLTENFPLVNIALMLSLTIIALLSKSEATTLSM